MSDQNFLPPDAHKITQDEQGTTLQCAKRGRAVPATPEERVRQRILTWLMENKWPLKKITLERSYEWIGNPKRTRIRSDIELLDDDGNTLLVVECKAPQVPLGPAVEKQALEYAIKSKSKYVWITNGEQHRFLVRKSRGTWKETDEIEPLDVDYHPDSTSFDFPKDVNNRYTVRKYFEKYFPEQGYDELKLNHRKMVLAFQKLFFGVDKTLPYSLGGAHILEDRGPDVHQFTNASGGYWRNLYADFIVATSGRVEALSLSIYPWFRESEQRLYLCVGAHKTGRTHHALQMNLNDCEWDSSKNCWHIYHDGRMANIPNWKVLDAVEESGAGDWIEDWDMKSYLYLGALPSAERLTWRNSKTLLINILHYGLIRSNLRDANFTKSA